MRTATSAAVLAATSLFAQQAHAALKAGDPVAFVSCPVAQDTGPFTDLCFFTEHEGQRVSLATPEFDTVGVMLKHKVLVEGRISAGPPECGGPRVEGMISPLPEISLECNEVRPVDPADAAPPETIGPEERKILSRLKADPSLSLQPMRFPEGPAPVTGATRWRMSYTFDSDRGDGTSLTGLVALVQQAIHDGASGIRIQARQSDARLEHGQVLHERAGLAEHRAEKIAGIIAGLGFPRDKITTSWGEETLDPGWQERWVEVELGK